MSFLDDLEAVQPRRLPNGFDLLDQRVLADFDTLREALAWEQRSINFGGKKVPVPRLVAMYGKAYTYSGIHHPERPLPPLLDEIRQQVERLTGVEFNAVLCNLYRGGQDSVSWHSDDDYEALHPTIASLSFGATRTFAIRSKQNHRNRFDVDLHDGSVLVMSGRSQDDWQHSIPKTSRPSEPRINLTFRAMH